MVLTLPIFLVSLFCSWFECEVQMEPPYLNLHVNNERRLLSTLSGYTEDEIMGRTYAQQQNVPLVFTKLGIIEGQKIKNADGNDIFQYTGVPYGEPPTGLLRFQEPVPKAPWKPQILKATERSPHCIQSNGATIGMIRGQEDCLYMDIHTPQDPRKRSAGEGYPVVMWIPAGTHAYGRSLSYGPSYWLRENVILVVINVRVGILGYLATGDEASAGNWALKDQALAIKWVYENIADFGGDPEKIIIGGLSSGAEAAHSMLFTKNEARNYIKGVYGMSGNLFAGHGLDSKGTVRQTSDIIAKFVGCPTSGGGRSWEMVECLRRMDPYMLTAYQFVAYNQLPLMTKMWRPTIEPYNLSNAYLTELPEDLYAKGEVPPIPLILSRAEDETEFFMKNSRLTTLQIANLNWWEWMPEFMQLTYRNTKWMEHIPYEQAKANFMKLMQVYFNKESPPRIFNRKDFRNYADMMNDGMYFVPMWKSLEYHNKIAPTYSYINKHHTFTINRNIRRWERLTHPSNAAHVSDFLLLFNSTGHIPVLPPGQDFDIASKNLINMIVNFAAHGKPLYRTESGDLKDYWKPIGDINNMMTLDVGLVNGINMIVDPLPSTMRKKIWEQVKF